VPGAAPPDARRVVLIDVDGVLVRGDTFGLFMRARFARAWWRKFLVLLLTPWLLAVWPFSWRRVLRTVVHVGLLGVGEARYHALGSAFVARLVREPHRFQRDALSALRRHLAAGDRVIVVSGCEDSLVRGVLAGLGLDGLEILASRLRPGRFGMRSAWHNVGRNKVALLAERGVTTWAIAYSDSAEDIPMLAGADEAVLVNASPRLCKRVEVALRRSVRRVEWP
jgi:phosphatidylglycerophosphatase C